MSSDENDGSPVPSEHDNPPLGGSLPDEITSSNVFSTNAPPGNADLFGNILPPIPPYIPPGQVGFDVGFHIGQHEITIKQLRHEINILKRRVDELQEERDSVQQSSENRSLKRKKK